MSFVDSPGFNRFITTVIIIAALVVGLETYHPLMERYHNLFSWLNNIILGIFALEVVLRFAATWPNPRHYFQSGWNLFDLAIVISSLIPGAAAYAPAMRLLRLLRVLRLVRAVPELQVILGALIRSIPAMGYVLLLLGLIVYMYAVAGVFLFGKNDPVHFRDLHTSLLTLFGSLTLEGWIDLMNIQFYGCDKVELPFPEQCTAPHPSPLAAVLFFVSFVMLGTMIFLNLLVGIVVNSMDEVRKSHERQKAGELEGDFNQIQDKLAEVQTLLQSFEDRWKPR